MNYQSQQINARMGLEEALNTFPGEICYLTLRDGTNIEIIPDNQPEMGYIDNHLHQQYLENDEFVEENVDENANNYFYKQTIQKQPGPLRGRGQNKPAKALRKTVLRSLDGSGKEKNMENNGKLRNVNDNLILKITEDNDFIQCANCFKFFPPSEEDLKNENANNPLTLQTPQKQKGPSQPQQNMPNYPQQKNQNFPPNQQKMPQNPQMGKQPRPNQQQQPRPGQKMPQNIPKQQPYMQVPPPHQKQKFPGGNINPNQPPMNMQFRGGQNMVFRARKKVSNRYDSNNDRYFNQKKNYYSNNNYMIEDNYYPASGKKQSSSNYKFYGEYPSNRKMTQNASYGNINDIRHLNLGFNRNNRQIIYTDNNLNDYMNNNTEYYETPYQYQYQENNIIPTGGRNVNNRKIVTIKTVNNQYQDYDYDYY